MVVTEENTNSVISILAASHNEICWRHLDTRGIAYRNLVASSRYSRQSISKFGSVISIIAASHIEIW